MGAGSFGPLGDALAGLGRGAGELIKGTGEFKTGRQFGTAGQAIGEHIAQLTKDSEDKPDDPRFQRQILNLQELQQTLDERGAKAVRLAKLISQGGEEGVALFEKIKTGKNITAGERIKAEAGLNSILETENADDVTKLLSGGIQNLPRKQRKALSKALIDQARKGIIQKAAQRPAGLGIERATPLMKNAAAAANVNLQDIIDGSASPEQQKRFNDKFTQLSVKGKGRRAEEAGVDDVLDALEAL